MASILPFPREPFASVSWAENAWRAALLSGNAEELERLLDDRYVFVDPQGDVSGKESDLKAHRHQLVHFSRLDVHESIMEDFGNATTVRLLVSLRGTFVGAPFDGLFRYLHTWVRQIDGWRLISSTATLVPVPSDF